MSTQVKTFEFASSTEGWVLTPAAGVAGAWFQQHPGHRTGSPPNSTYGGSLRTTIRKNQSSAENYWEYSGTWEDLGVPSSSVVTAVNLDYNYRWIAPNPVALKTRRSILLFTNTEAGSGPAELRDSGGTLIDTMSTRVFSIARTLLNLWGAYPRSPDYPYSSFQSTDYPISATPPSWGTQSGTPISVPALQQASSTSIKLRLRSLLPATPNILGSWLRMKQDHVVVTMTYSAAPPSSDTSGLLKMF